jgi:NADPH:quinone reductase-like Zn-dependent oxidoreductase
MKAIVREKYGPPDVLHLEEVERPSPAEGQVLVKVSAASLNKADWYDLKAPFPMRFMMGGVRKPKSRMVGSDLAGVVETVGSGVTQFRPGDRVFGTGAALAEYALAREARLAKIPDKVGFEEAAALPVAAITALQGLRKGGIREGQKVLIYGSSGGVGTFAVQIAKALGAEVTAVCSPRNLEKSRALGADHVVDYTREDFSKNGQKYDLILAVNGNRSVLAFRHSLTPAGVFLLVGASKLFRSLIPLFILGPVISRLGSRKMGFMGIAKINQDDLNYLAALLESGKVKPLIDRTYPLAESAEAFRQFGDGHVQGKIVVTV